MIKPNDGAALAHHLLHVILLSETLNHRCALAARRSDPRAKRDWVPITRDPLVRGVCDAARKSGELWKPHTPILRFAKRYGIAPVVEERIVDAWARLVGPNRNLHDTSRLNDRMSLYRIPDLARGGKRSCVDFSVGRIGPSRFDEFDGVRHVVQSEEMDPIEATQAYLIDVVGVKGSAVYHYTQRFIRGTFHLLYTENMKLAIHDLCERLNDVFFGSSTPARWQTDDVLPNVVGTQLLLHEIRESLKEAVRADYDDKRFKGIASPQGEELGWEEIADHVAVGTFLLLRMCRLLDGRSQWVDDDTRPIRRRTGADSERVSASNWRHMLREFRHIHPAVAGTRPFENSYVQSRFFGAISGVPGLNFIFRGGLLPTPTPGRCTLIRGAPGSGKTTLALHQLADMAMRGRVGVYMSFEDRHPLLIDKLSSLGLLDVNRYQLLESRSSEELGSVRHKVQTALAQGFGTLVFHRIDSGVPRTMIEEIKRIANELEGVRSWKAIALDSVNALEFFPPESSGAMDTTFDRRLQLRDLVEAIEDSGLWGVLVGEHDTSGALSALEYLVHTVISLGIDANRGNRWISILKCKGQKHHLGQHHFRIDEGRGCVIYPSLPAVSATIRRRRRVAPARNTVIFGDSASLSSTSVPAVHEKSSVLVSGADQVRNLRFALSYAAEPSSRGATDLWWASPNGRKLRTWKETPRNVLIVSFERTASEIRKLLGDPVLRVLWERIPRKDVRWFSPGDRLTAGQVIRELWSYFERSRQAGADVDRIVVDGLDRLEDLLPLVASETLFVPTLFQFVKTHPTTAFYITGDDLTRSPVRPLLSSFDYCFEVHRSAELSVTRSPHFPES